MPSKPLSCLLSSLALVLVARAAAAQIPGFSHVFVIVMENHEIDDVIGNPAAPFINSLAARYGLANNEYAVTHPSLPNYMALTGGDTFFTDDCAGCTTSAVNLLDRIEASGRRWTAYMEDMPSACATADSGLYTARHNPFVHFADIVGNPARCSSAVVPFPRFSTDLVTGALADFVWITPNVCNDMHDCSVSAGDAWLASVVPQILNSAAFSNSVLFIAWDEGTTTAGGGGHIPLIVASPMTPAGMQSDQLANHYSVLRTIEDAWSLSPVGQSANATALASFFPRATTLPAEQVIYASDVTTFTGQWRKVADSTAAGGVKLATTDAGSPTIDAPQASPASYFETAFDAVPGTRYRVWLRIHAAGDSKWNDSVWVQFSDSVDAGGNPVYRINTGAGYIVNLWTCATCQSFGWGWQRNAYWLGDSGDVWFPTGGRHTIRIQVREDGAEIDQIVISPSQYANAAPGPVSGDTTIVPHPSGALPPPPPPPPSPGNIVVYASDLQPANLHGAWTLTSDPTAAGSTKLTTPNNGVSAISAPLATPADYVDVAVTAAAGTPYTIWLRLKALNNDKFNDSVWVQFSDAQSGGAPVYEIGTTSGLMVNLATDSSASSLVNWGWQNTAYWLSQATTITFGASGTHTLRIQVREDGVQLDQIVLSPSTYLSAAPGPATNDTTIVPK